MENTKKQEYIINDLKKRIKNGVYPEKLLKPIDLVSDFGVNFKTIDKAVNKLIGQGPTFYLTIPIFAYLLFSSCQGFNGFLCCRFVYLRN